MNTLGAGGTASSSLARQRQTPIGFWVFLSFVVVTIVYGSLFPFDFSDQPKPFDSLYSNANLFGNIADAIENFFLFAPLGIALYACFPRTHERMIAALLAILLLGFGIQVIQLYLPSRTASLSDVFWNTIGLLFGLLAGRAFHGWLVKRFAPRTSANTFALLLVLLWFCYESFPFVPTLDYGLLREHVKSAIYAPPFEAIRFFQHLLAGTLAGIALQRSSLATNTGVLTAFAGILAVGLEIFVAYGSLRRETLLGIIVGLVGGHLLSKSGDKPARIALASVALAAYLMTMATPYRGQIADGGFTFTPFSKFLWHNVTSDLPPLAYEALAIGSLIWAGLLVPGRIARQPIGWIMLIVLIIAGLEAYRTLIIGLHGDTTTMLVTVILGAFALGRRTTPAPAAFALPATPSSSIHDHHDNSFHAWPQGVMGHVLTIALLAFLAYVVGHLPGVPYNVRELFPAGGGGIIAALALAMALYLAVNSAFVFLVAGNWRRLVAFPLLLPVQGIIIWTLLRMGVPLESIHDIVGAPILDWPWEWEMLLRFLALHQAIATQMLGAVLLVATLCRPSLFAGLLYWLAVSLVFSWPLHLIVVEKAATDNLVELMRNHAVFSASSLLAAGIFSAFVGGAALSAAFVIPHRRLALLATTILAAPLAALCFHAGLEPVIVKYGKVFSAAQFLLSPDRSHYLQSGELLVRAAIAYLALTTSIAMLQWQAWRHMTSLAGNGDKTR